MAACRLAANARGSLPLALGRSAQRWAGLGPRPQQRAMAAKASGRSGFKNLSLSQKVIYVSVIINVGVCGFVWLKRQLKMSEKEAREMDEMKAMTEAIDATSLSDSSNKFRCFFAAQHYHMLGTSSPEEEKSPEIQKILEVLAQCREDLYRRMPDETPAMRPLHAPLL